MSPGDHTEGAEGEQRPEWARHLTESEYRKRDEQDRVQRLRHVAHVRHLIQGTPKIDGCLHCIPHAEQMRHLSVFLMADNLRSMIADTWEPLAETCLVTREFLPKFREQLATLDAEIARMRAAITWPPELAGVKA